jgi:hypothetical protein
LALTHPDSPRPEEPYLLYLPSYPHGKALPENSRRHFLGSLGAAFAAPEPLAGLAAAQAATDAAGNPIPKKVISNPYIYKFSIGKFEAWSISDGFGTFKQGVTKKMWPPAERAEMSKALTALGERPDDMTLYVNILLLRKDKEVILVDAGFGPTRTPRGAGSPTRWTASASSSRT